jgi:hypothetical protein
MKDAVVRNVVWSVEGDEEDPDAEGEPDEGYVLTADGTYEKQTAIGDDLPVPIGFRNQEGMIVPIPLEENGDGQARYVTEDETDAVMDVDPVTQTEALFEGMSEPVPTRVGELVSLHSVSKRRKLFLSRLRICQMQPMYRCSISLSRYILPNSLGTALSHQTPAGMLLLCPAPSPTRSLALISRLALIIQRPGFVKILTLIHRYSAT